ncbi:PREDICTED: probable transcription factor At1g44810 [Camelina sativa]|uniref:Probable transcription factor At1g44810 n=1 Tax=Camelina sativa TaxID=90675 RepID=A0ABM0SU20_CAMSA|nr:PREDICTED: probable transcription factor At1g44810 [Camelina sativa]
MAKKVLNPLEDPPTASSSSDEEEVESSSSGEEGEEQQQQQLSISDEPKNPSPKPLKTPSTAAAAAPSSGSEKKRASEEANEEHAKRAKTLSQKSPFARIWSEDDEISLLQGMIRFKAEKGTSPYDDMNGFFLVTKDSISFDATKTQFVEKIRSLKNKYYNKGKDSRSFLKPHDVKCFKLASCIWGSDDAVALLDSAPPVIVKSPPVAVKSPPVDVISNKVDKKKKKKLEFGDEEMQVLGSDDGMALLDSAPPVAVTLAVKPPPVAVISNKVVDKKKKKKLEVEDKEKKVLGSDDGMALLDSAPAVKSPPVAVISNQVDKKNKNKKKKKLEVEDEKVQVLGSDGMVLESAAVVKANGSLKPEGDTVEKDKEVVILLGGVSESSDLFDKSFLVPLIVSLGGVDECSVKHKWSKVPMETKKRIEDKLKLVEAKEFELLLQKSDIVKEVASVITQAI